MSTVEGSGDQRGGTAQDRALARLVARRHEAETAAVVADLSRRGVTAVVLKGVGVAHHLYPDEVRPSSDVDLLVAPREQRRARRALVGLGYARFGRQGHATSWTAPGRVPVDLHRTLPFCQAGPGRVWRTLAAHRTTVRVADGPTEAGSEVVVLDAPATAVHLTIHLTQGATERPLEDLRRAVAVLSDDEWRAARRIAAALGTEASMAWALGQVPGGDEVRASLGLVPVERGAVPASKPSEAGGYAIARAIVAQANRPTAVILVNESISIGLYRGLNEANVRPGRDIAVIGRDSPQTRFLSPALTGYEQSLRDLGIALGEALLASMPIGLVAFPGSGISGNLCDKAKKLGIPVWHFGEGGA